METTEQKHYESLAQILTQRLDDYGLEIVSCVALENIPNSELFEMKRRMERFLEALDKVTG